MGINDKHWVFAERELINSHSRVHLDSLFCPFGLFCSISTYVQGMNFSYMCTSDMCDCEFMCIQIAYVTHYI